MAVTNIRNLITHGGKLKGKRKCSHGFIGNEKKKEFIICFTLPNNFLEIELLKLILKSSILKLLMKKDNKLKKLLNLPKRRLKVLI